jgi:hypothetical protein
MHHSLQWNCFMVSTGQDIRGMEGEWILAVDPWKPYASPSTCNFHSYNSSLFSWLWKERPLVGGCDRIGRSVSYCLISSAIIEDIKRIRKTTSALIAYYYFDFKDVTKRDLRGLLSSLVIQLADRSDRCRGALSELYTTCGDGTEQPSEDALAQCLNEIARQFPIYIVIDALDECPNNVGSPSTRKQVLDLIEDMIRWKHANLYLCITSRPEQDVQSTLNPLTPTSCRVSLREESGQRQDINNYIRSFVYANESMKRWKTEDKELVINTLTEQAEGM